MIKYIFDNVIFLCFLPKCVVCDWRGGMGGGQRFEQLMYFYHWQFTEFSSRHWGSSSWTIWIWTIPGLHTWAVWPIARFWACQSEPGWLSGSSPDCLSCTEYRWPGRIVNIYDCSKTLHCCTSETRAHTILSHQSSTAKKTVPRMYPRPQEKTSPIMFCTESPGKWRVR